MKHWNLPIKTRDVVWMSIITVTVPIILLHLTNEMKQEKRISIMNIRKE